MENTIEFKGPFNINHLEKDLEKELKQPGIYIWGFMVDSNYNPLNCKNIVSFSPEKMKFLPYYVGMATGKGKNNKMTIYMRLNQHKDVRNNASAIKYTRLSMKYLKTFFKDDSSFPIKTSNSNITNKFIEIDKKSNHTLIEYYNNSRFLDYKINDSNNDKSKINNEKPTNNPITNFCTINDTLQEIIIEKNNFWFCYVDVESSKKSIDNKDMTAFYESLESLTYFSLKGKTISKVKKWSGDDKGYVIKDVTKTNIFKLEPSTEFPGY
jgi:hypothetical protein